MKNYYIKTNRVFNPIRKYSWLITVMVAIGGLWFPKLGLIVLVIMASLLTTAFFNGRYWCGNVCPHGSLFDRIIYPISRNSKIPGALKTKVFVTLFFLFFVANLARRVVRVIGLWGTYAFLDKLGFVFVMTYLVVMVAGGFLALILTPRTWCQFCPMGTLQKFSHRLGKTVRIAQKTEKKLTVSAKEKCHSCGKCARVCPFQLQPYLEFSDNNQFDNPNCIKCGTCVANCPAGILSTEKERVAVKLKSDVPAEGYENVTEISARITKINAVSNDINEYVLKFISPERLEIKAGQFILVKIQDEPKQYRAYSISSIADGGTGLSIIIKKVEKGYGTAKIFDGFKAGDTIELKGPMGNELVIDPAAEKVLFVANGIGITPFIAMAKSSLKDLPHVKHVKLLAGQRTKDELIYNEYFRELGSDKQFEYIPILSRDQFSGLKSGYVTDAIREMHHLKGYKVYMCGSKNMITDSYNLLIEKGVKKEDIHYESEEKIALK